MYTNEIVAKTITRMGLQIQKALEAQTFGRVNCSFRMDTVAPNKGPSNGWISIEYVIEVGRDQRSGVSISCEEDSIFLEERGFPKRRLALGNGELVIVAEEEEDSMVMDRSVFEWTPLKKWINDSVNERLQTLFRSENFPIVYVKF